MAKHIDVQWLVGSAGGCSHCEVRYDRIAQWHDATWLIQWHPSERETCAWLACDAQLVHALQLVHTYFESMAEFTKAIRRGETAQRARVIAAPVADNKREATEDGNDSNG